MKIVVYGSGCKNCKALHENTLKAVEATGTEATVDYVTDLKVIVSKGFITMPVLEIDGKVVSKGRVPSENEIAEFLK